MTLRQGMAGRTPTIWADLTASTCSWAGTCRARSLPGCAQELAFLARRGARPVAPAALQRRGGIQVLAAGQAVEVDRKVQRDGRALVNGGNR